MRQRVLSRSVTAVWLIGLCAYVLAGVPLATFHGDESMQIHMSRDYATAFIDRDPAALITQPPYPIDSDQHLRIINGSVNRYAIGLSWHLAGLTTDDLPPPPGWDWGLSYADGVATGHRPAPDYLTIMRLSSALFTAGSVIVLFALGWLIGGRWLAVFASGIYALHPVILLNGRRAMQEGSMLFFGLLAVLIAAQLSQRRAREQNPLWLWLVLIVVGALALASKHSGAVFVAGAYLWVFAAEIGGRRCWLRLMGQLALAGVVTLALFVVLSPALWHNPPARFVDLLGLRGELITIQIAIDPAAPTTFTERFAGLLTEPFIAPPVHYELPSWGRAGDFLAEIDRYMMSPLSGVQYSLVGGGLLILLALVGIGRALRRRESNDVGLLAWLGVTAASLLVNPLPWQRYNLPLIPIMIVLAGVGLLTLWRRLEMLSPNSPLDR